jgi:hypothetical protein
MSTAAPRHSWQVDETLVVALLDLLAFLELSGDTVVDPDAAVNQMEATAYRLARLPPADQTRLIELITARAANEPDQERAAFFASLPEAIGLQ